MDKIAYAQAVTRIRYHETLLLHQNKINQMAEAADAKEVLKLLQDTKYSSYVADLTRIEDYEGMLSKALLDLYTFLKEMLPDKRFLDIFLTRYDYHNLKVLLKGKTLGTDVDSLVIPIGVIPVDKLKMYIASEKYMDMHTCMREVVEKAVMALSVDKDPQKMELLLDNALYKDMLLQAKAFGDSFLIEYLIQQIDLINVKTLLRVKKQGKGSAFFKDAFIEGAKLDKEMLLSFLGDSLENFTARLSHTDYYKMLKSGMEQYLKVGKLSILEKFIDNYLMEFTQKAKFISFGPEPALAYIAAVEAEIKVVRMIIVGKLNHVSSKNLRERLRDIYV